MHAVIYANFERIRDKNIVRQVVKILTDKSISYTMSSDIPTTFEGEEVFLLKDCVNRANIFVILGGDGTILNAVKIIGTHNAPILSINFGTVGFLTEVEPDEIEYAFSLVAQERFSIEERALLEIIIGDKSHYALNELVLSKGINTRPIKIKVDYDGNFLDKYFADGLIVSTPTGSTAYSLSSNGPILAPDIKAIIVNPICAHSLHSRPIVMADTHEITVTATELYDSADIIIDGQFICNVEKNTPVIVKKAEHTAKFIKVKNVEFYDKLLKKLNYWGVTTVEKE